MDDESPDARLEQAVELMVRIAAGDLNARGPSSERGDSIDAIITGLNMLAEELGDEKERRRRAEELLRDERDAYDRAPGLFCSLDAKTLEIVKCNRTLADRLGRPRESLLGRSVLEVLHPDSREEAERILRQLATTGRAPPTELRLLAVDGRLLLVTMDATLTRDEHQGDRLRLMWRDVTAEKDLEAQLLQAQKMDAIGRLSGGVAHDFNNILSVIIGAGSMLLESLGARPSEAEDVRMILDAANRGAALTSDLLAFSRRQVVDLQPTDLRTLVEEAQRMVGRVVDANIQVDLHLSDRPLVCLADRSRLNQVIMNLVINARDAMPDGGRLTIEAFHAVLDEERAAERIGLVPGQYAVIAVSDTGVGMDPEILARAFEPFFTTKEMGKGIGLGLSMCYGIVQQAGGRIWIYSEVGKGTTVKVYLPLVEEVERAPVAVEPVAAGGGETILLVEDQRDVRTIAKRILERAGYRVLVATDGENALEVAAATEGPIDLVVTDVMMPAMGGREMAEALKVTRPDIHVLFVSGYTANSIVTHGVLHVDTPFLAKPFTPSALLAAVRKAIDSNAG